MRRAGVLFTGGSKLLTVAGAREKLTPADDRAAGHRRSPTSIIPKPKAVSLTQATEVGTVYSVDGS